MAVSLEILCIDDDPVVVQTLRLVLESEGHHVIGATSLDEAAELAQTSKIDMALIEHRMCAGQGRCIREELIKNGCDAQCVLHSSSVNVHDAVCLKDIPKIAKSTSPEELVSRVNAIAAQL